MVDEKMRVDKWLWAVRIYKTRSLATDACKSGKIKVNTEVVKPSREIKVDDVIDIRTGGFHKTIQVKGLLNNRVGAKLVEQYLNDLTPAEELEKLKMQHNINSGYRDRGAGRPTKKDRRQLDNLEIW